LRRFNLWHSQRRAEEVAEQLRDSQVLVATLDAYLNDIPSVPRLRFTVGGYPAVFLVRGSG